MSSLLQTLDGDIAITGGKLTIVNDRQEKAQKIANRLAIFRGEWFLDLRIGTPWWEQILGVKNPQLSLIKRILRAAILSVPGIVDVKELTVTVNAQRQLFYEYVAVDAEGQQITGSEPPYVLDAR